MTSIQKTKKGLWSSLHTAKVAALALAVTLFWLKVAGLPSSGFGCTCVFVAAPKAHFSQLCTTLQSYIGLFPDLRREQGKKIEAIHLIKCTLSKCTIKLILKLIIQGFFKKKKHPVLPYCFSIQWQ